MILLNIQQSKFERNKFLEGCTIKKMNGGKSIKIQKQLKKITDFNRGNLKLSKGKLFTK
jgi:hypothetical protein